MTSSTTNALSRQPLVQVLRNITDPRDRRGVRHNLSTVLPLAVTGVLAGCRSLTAIWEHATDLTGADLEALGLPSWVDASRPVVKVTDELTGDSYEWSGQNYVRLDPFAAQVAHVFSVEPL